MAAPERAVRLVRIQAHDAGTRSLFLRLPGDERLAFVPGQFVSCLLPVDGATLTRPYSLASDPEETELEICLDRVPGGAGSAHLFGLAPGATVRLTGPWGTFMLDQAPDAEAVFVAAGTGVAPIRPMIGRALASGPRHPVRLLYATAPGQPILWRAEWERLARDVPAFSWTHIAVAPLRAEVARRWIEADGERSRHFWICGVGPIVHELRDLLRQAGYARRAVRYEKW